MHDGSLPVFYLDKRAILCNSICFPSNEEFLLDSTVIVRKVLAIELVIPLYDTFF